MGEKDNFLGADNIIWDLKDLYNDINAPEIKEAIQWAQDEAGKIEDEYKGKVASLSSEKLLTLVKRIEKVNATYAKAYSYAFLEFSTDCASPEKGAFLQFIKEEGVNIEKRLVFFELEWQKVEDERANRLLASQEISDYRHYLQLIRRFTPHTLTEAEEKILIEISPVGRSSWVTLFEKIMTSLSFGDEKKTQEEILSLLYHPDRDMRKKAHKEFTEGLSSVEHILTHCFNTVLQDKAIEDRLRKYPSWISSRNIANDLKDETVDILINCVKGNYHIVEKYYKKKQVILGIDTLYDYDRYAPIEGMPDEAISWDEAKDIVLEAYYGFSEEFGKIGELFFEKGWIHAPVAAGKMSGAFSHPTVPQAHPYILLNYTGRVRDVETLAHELGHGIHQYLSREVGYFNSNTPLPLAETASVFGEMLVFKRLLDRYDAPEKKRALLCEKIESIFATVFRQVSMNRFEHEIHTKRRQVGELSPEDFSKIWLSTQREMFGGSVALTEEYGKWWSYISHFIHTPGYVYAYAFGELLVLALFKIYEGSNKDEFVRQYIKLLSSGGKYDPYTLLKPFNVDLNDNAFWEQGLNKINEMVEMIETS